MMFSWYCIIAGLPVGGYENSTWTRCFCYDCLYSCHSKGPCCSEGETSSEVPSQSCRDGNRELNCSQLVHILLLFRNQTTCTSKVSQLPLLMFQHMLGVSVGWFISGTAYFNMVYNGSTTNTQQYKTQVNKNIRCTISDKISPQSLFSLATNYKP